jgi:ABC-type transporter Mla subunit MlaD
VSAGRDTQSAAAAAAERVRAVLEAAEQSAAELRAEAAEEIEAQLAKAQTVAQRLSTRANEIERALQSLAESIREELSALKADLEELRAVGEGVAAARAEVAEEAGAPPAPAPAEVAGEAEAPPAPASAEAPAAAVEQPDTHAEPVQLPAGQEGARVIALNMALNGSSREETAHYLSENFELDDPDALLDEVYSRVSR